METSLEPHHVYLISINTYAALLASEVRQLFHRRLYQRKVQNSSGNMFESKICQYNETGFCKFREHCRKRHENKICQENHDYKSHGCTVRHPKKCRNYEREGTCKFKECAYTHQENQGDEKYDPTNGK